MLLSALVTRCYTDSRKRIKHAPSIINREIWSDRNHELPHRARLASVRVAFMKKRQRLIALFCGASALITAPGFTAHAVSGDPRWGARAPAQCTPLKQSQPPSAAQAAQLFRCEKETASESSGELWLVEDLKVEIGGATPFAAMYRLVTMREADTSKRVYPIRGSWTWSTCISRRDAGLRGADPGLNCRETPVSGATGACWQTTFGDWKCTMNGTSGAIKSPTRPRAV